MLKITNTRALTCLLRKTLTLAQTAELIGTTTVTVMHWERGDRRASWTFSTGFRRAINHMASQFEEWPALRDAILNIEVSVSGFPADRKVSKHIAKFLRETLSRPRPMHVVMVMAGDLRFNKSTVRKVAKEMNVVMTVKGFGRNRMSMWSLPNEDD